MSSSFSADPVPEKMVIDAIVKEENGLWTVSCVEFADIKGTGGTREEAIARAKEAWLAELLRVRDRVLAPPTGDVKTRLERTLAVFSELGGIANIKARFEVAEMALPDIRAALAFDSDQVFVVQPLIETLAQCYAAKCDVAGVDRVCEIIYAGDPDLALGRFVAESAVRQLEWANLIVTSLRGAPGITQFALREKLQIEKGEMTGLVRRMEALGVIRRAATDRTFHLYLTEAGA